LALVIIFCKGKQKFINIVIPNAIIIQILQILKQLLQILKVRPSSDTKKENVNAQGTVMQNN
jgi:hypothetical protein